MAVRTLTLAAAATLGTFVAPTLGAPDGGLCSHDRFLFDMDNEAMGDFHKCVSEKVDGRDIEGLFKGLDDGENCEKVMDPVTACFSRHGYDHDINCYYQLRDIMMKNGGWNCAWRYFSTPYNCMEAVPIWEWSPDKTVGKELWAGMTYSMCMEDHRSDEGLQSNSWDKSGDYSGDYSGDNRGDYSGEHSGDISGYHSGEWQEPDLKPECRARLECTVNCARQFCKAGEMKEDECYTDICDGDDVKFPTTTGYQPIEWEVSNGVARVSAAVVLIGVFSAAAPVAFWRV